MKERQREIIRERETERGGEREREEEDRQRQYIAKELYLTIKNII